MKRSILLLGVIASLASAQTTLPLGDLGSTSTGIVEGIVGVIMVSIFYIAAPIVMYCLGSYSLARLDKHYKKARTSGVSWIPFVRYYHIIKNATGSKKKAFIVTVLPWIVTVCGIGGLIAVAILGDTMYPSDQSVIWPLLVTMGSVGVLGFFGIIAMNFWRAFIIKRYVKGDTTTAFGLSTYTTLVLWYIALDRTTGKTDIIGKIGFICLGLVALLYGVVFGSVVYGIIIGGFSY